MPSGYLLLFSEQEYPEIVPYPDMVLDIVMVQETEPVLPDKFSISQETADSVPSKPSDEIIYQCHAFIRIGIASLVKHLEHQWYGNVSIANAKHQDIDVPGSKLPVGSIHY